MNVGIQKLIGDNGIVKNKELFHNKLEESYVKKPHSDIAYYLKIGTLERNGKFVFSNANEAHYRNNDHLRLN